MKIGDIIEWSPLGKRRKALNHCERCGTSGPHLDWSRRVFMGVGNEMGVVAPCDCAKDHKGRWLTAARKVISEKIVMSQGRDWDQEIIWANEFMFPLPENTCDCTFCEVWRE